MPINLRETLIGPRGSIIPHAEFKPSPSPIQPQPDKPVVVWPEDFTEGNVEVGFQGVPADVLLFISAANIAGDGPTTQTRQTSRILQIIGEQGKIPVYYVGPEQTDSDIAVDTFTGSLPPTITLIDKTGDSIPKKYEITVQTMTETLKKLWNMGKRKIFAVSTGYTAFASYGLKEALGIINQGKSGDEIMKAILVNQDSSFPDADFPSSAVNESTGRPTDRFNPEAYVSNEYTKVWLITNSWPHFNIKRARRRAPKGTLCAAATFPFTPEYAQNWAKWRELPKEEAQLQLADMVKETHPKFAEILLEQNIVFVPLIASAGYFDQTNVGKWLTQEQFEDMSVGSKNLILALLEVSKATGRDVVFAGVTPCVDYIMSLGIKDVVDLEQSLYIDRSSSKVMTVRIPRFPQDRYGIFHRAMDVMIQRTGQANTAAEGLLARVPQIILTMPAHKYMQAEVMDFTFKEQGGRQYGPDVDPKKLATRIISALDPDELRALVARSDTLFMQQFNHKGMNFGAILSYLAGFPIR